MNIHYHPWKLASSEKAMFRGPKFESRMKAWRWLKKEKMVGLKSGVVLECLDDGRCTVC